MWSALVPPLRLEVVLEGDEEESRPASCGVFTIYSDGTASSSAAPCDRPASSDVFTICSEGAASQERGLRDIGADDDVMQLDLHVDDKVLTMLPAWQSRGHTISPVSSGIAAMTQASSVPYTVMCANELAADLVRESCELFSASPISATSPAAHPGGWVVPSGSGPRGGEFSVEGSSVQTLTQGHDLMSATLNPRDGLAGSSQEGLNSNDTPASSSWGHHLVPPGDDESLQLWPWGRPPSWPPPELTWSEALPLRPVEEESPLEDPWRRGGRASPSEVSSAQADDTESVAGRIAEAVVLSSAEHGGASRDGDRERGDHSQVPEEGDAAWPQGPLARPPAAAGRPGHGHHAAYRPPLLGKSSSQKTLASGTTGLAKSMGGPGAASSSSSQACPSAPWDWDQHAGGDGMTGTLTVGIGSDPPSQWDWAADAFEGLSNNVLASATLADPPSMWGWAQPTGCRDLRFSFPFGDDGSGSEGAHQAELGEHRMKGGSGTTAPGSGTDHFALHEEDEEVLGSGGYASPGSAGVGFPYFPAPESRRIPGLPLPRAAGPEVCSGLGSATPEDRSILWSPSTVSIADQLVNSAAARAAAHTDATPSEAPGCGGSSSPRDLSVARSSCSASLADQLVAHAAQQAAASAPPQAVAHSASRALPPAPLLPAAVGDSLVFSGPSSSTWELIDSRSAAPSGSLADKLVTTAVSQAAAHATVGPVATAAPVHAASAARSRNPPSGHQDALRSPGSVSLALCSGASASWEGSLAGDLATNAIVQAAAHSPPSPLPPPAARDSLVLSGPGSTAWELADSRSAVFSGSLADKVVATAVSQAAAHTTVGPVATAAPLHAPSAARSRHPPSGHQDALRSPGSVSLALCSGASASWEGSLAGDLANNAIVQASVPSSSAPRELPVTSASAGSGAGSALAHEYISPPEPQASTVVASATEDEERDRWPAAHGLLSTSPELGTLVSGATSSVANAFLADRALAGAIALAETEQADPPSLAGASPGPSVALSGQASAASASLVDRAIAGAVVRAAAEEAAIAPPPQPADRPPGQPGPPSLAGASPGPPFAFSGRASAASAASPPAERAIADAVAQDVASEAPEAAPGGPPLARAAARSPDPLPPIAGASAELFAIFSRPPSAVPSASQADPLASAVARWAAAWATQGAPPEPPPAAAAARGLSPGPASVASLGPAAAASTVASAASAEDFGQTAAVAASHASSVGTSTAHGAVAAATARGVALSAAGAPSTATVTASQASVASLGPEAAEPAEDLGRVAAVPASHASSVGTSIAHGAVAAATARGVALSAAGAPSTATVTASLASVASLGPAAAAATVVSAASAEDLGPVAAVPASHASSDGTSIAHGAIATATARAVALSAAGAPSTAAVTASSPEIWWAVVPTAAASTVAPSTLEEPPAGAPPPELAPPSWSAAPPQGPPPAHGRPRSLRGQASLTDADHSSRVSRPGSGSTVNSFSGVSEVVPRALAVDIASRAMHSAEPILGKPEVAGGQRPRGLPVAGSPPPAAGSPESVLSLHTEPGSACTEDEVAAEAAAQVAQAVQATAGPAPAGGEPAPAAAAGQRDLAPSSPEAAGGPDPAGGEPAPAAPAGQRDLAPPDPEAALPPPPSKQRELPLPEASTCPATSPGPGGFAEAPPPPEYPPVLPRLLNVDLKDGNLSKFDLLEVLRKDPELVQTLGLNEKIVNDDKLAMLSLCFGGQFDRALAEVRASGGQVLPAVPEVQAEPAVPRPPSIRYARSGLRLLPNVPMSLKPTISGLAPEFLGRATSSFRVSPPLPEGLMLDAATGRLHGCVSTPWPRAKSYEVVAEFMAAGAEPVVLWDQLLIAVPDPMVAPRDLPARKILLGIKPAGRPLGEEDPLGIRLDPPPMGEEDQEACFAAVRSGDAAALTELLRGKVLSPSHVNSPHVVDAHGRTLLVAARAAPDQTRELLEGVAAEWGVGGVEATSRGLDVDDAPPVDVAYPTVPPVLAVGLPCQHPPDVEVEVAFSAAGTAVEYSIEPPLPDGLCLDGHSGFLRGVPTREVPARDYEVRVVVQRAGQRGMRTGRVALRFAVLEPLQGFSYPQIEQILDAAPLAPPPLGDEDEQEEACSGRPSAAGSRAGSKLAASQAPKSQFVAAFRARPMLAAGKPERFGVSPPLPEGMKLDERTGVITGVPDAQKSVHHSRHTIFAENGWGSVSCTVSIEVHMGAWGLKLLGFRTIDPGGSRPLSDKAAVPPPSRGITPRAVGASALSTVDWPRALRKAAIILERFGHPTPVALDAEGGAGARVVLGMDIASLARCLGLVEGDSEHAPLLLQREVQRGFSNLGVAARAADGVPVVFLQARNPSAGVDGKRALVRPVVAAKALPPIFSTLPSSKEALSPGWSVPDSTRFAPIAQPSFPRKALPDLMSRLSRAR